MVRLEFKKGELNRFIGDAQLKLKFSTYRLANELRISARTLRDWKREKFKPDQDSILKLSNLSGVKIPSHKLLPRYWYVLKGASEGGKKRYQLHGLLGTREDRSKGGKASWNRRRENPILWKKYTKTFWKPQDSEDLAEFIGIMLGDGGLTRFQCTIYLHTEFDKEFIEYVGNLIYRLFGSKPRIYPSSKYKVTRLSVSGVNLVKYLTLKGLNLGNKVALQAQVPKWIEQEPGYVKKCIRGLIDTDGSFVLHRYKVKGKEYVYPKISFTNRSQPLLDFIYEGLEMFGFHPKRSYKYQVWLHNQNEVRRYLRELGTRNYKAVVKKIMEGGPDGKAMVC